MVCIRSNEKMILYHMNNLFEQAGESPIFFYGNSNNTIWLEYETWVEKMKKREVEPNLTYFFISSQPINPYEIYSNLKMVFQLGKGFVSNQIQFEVLICLVDNELMELDNLQQQVKDLCEYLQKQFEGNVLQNKQLGKLIPFTKPISIEALVKTVNRGNFNFVEVRSLEQDKKHGIQASYSRHQHLLSEKQLIDQILGYIN